MFAVVLCAVLLNPGLKIETWGTRFGPAPPVGTQQARQSTVKPTDTTSGSIPPARTGQLPPVEPGVTVVAARPTTSPAVTNSQTPGIDRANLTFTAWDLELLVRPAASSLAARARITVRNDRATPRDILPLQISSTLNWQAVSLNGSKLQMDVHQLDSDLDHTGIVNEAIVHLPEPLAPGASITLDALYEGAIELSGARIEHLGAPRDMAQHTDWDRIAGDFTGLRGFGTVLWYPVAAAPVTLGDGAKLFHDIGLWKLREQAATMRIRLRVDLTTDLDTSAAAGKRSGVLPRTTPRVAMMNAVRFALEPGVLDQNDSLLEAELPATPIGFAIPSLFLVSWDQLADKGLRMYARDSDQPAAQGFVTALEQVRPLVGQWLGAQKRDLTLLDTPGLQDSAFETQPWWNARQGTPLLVTPMLAQNPQGNTLNMAHALAHASFLSPRAWLNEGVPQFITSLWIGNSGNPAQALGALEEQRPALALAETADPGANPGEPLVSASDDIFLRTKAAYVLWMLRDIAGDEALTTALHAYRPEADDKPEYFQKLVEAACHKDLQWFFDDWVYRDRGLPELKIANVVSHKLDTVGESWFVSVDVTNSGYASAEVPVTVHSRERAETQRVRVPARGSVTAHIVVHAQPTSVTVNNGVVPEVNATVHETQITPAQP